MSRRCRHLSRLASGARAARHFRDAQRSAHGLAAKRGYVEGRNVVDRIPLGGGRYDRLPALAAELVRRPVVVIVASGTPVGARGQGSNDDDSDRLRQRRRPGAARPCREPRPAGRQRHRRELFVSRVGAKRLELLRELVPTATRSAVLVNPDNPATDADMQDCAGGGRTLGMQILVVNASTEREIDAAFEASVQRAAERARHCRRAVLHQPARSAGRAGGASSRCPRSTTFASSPRPAG